VWNEVAHYPHAVTSSASGSRLNVVFRGYKGDCLANRRSTKCLFRFRKECQGSGVTGA
jgi:hypothetical protein